jgi:hypothetical protein
MWVLVELRMNIEDSRIIAKFQCLLTEFPGRETIGTVAPRVARRIVEAQQPRLWQ